MANHCSLRSASHSSQQVKANSMLFWAGEQQHASARWAGALARELAEQPTGQVPSCPIKSWALHVYSNRCSYASSSGEHRNQFTTTSGAPFPTGITMQHARVRPPAADGARAARCCTLPEACLLLVPPYYLPSCGGGS